MHIYFMTRGIKHEVDRFVEGLSNQYLPYDFIDPKDKKMKKGSLQVRLSPIQLWDVSFPEPHRDAMLTTLFGAGKKKKGIAINKRHNKWAALIRKILGVKKIPQDYKTDKLLPTPPKHTEIVAIGMKDDYYQDGQEMI